MAEHPEHRYDPHEIEPRWQEVWARERTWEVANDSELAERGELGGRDGAAARAPTCSRCCRTRAASRTSGI